MRFRFSDFFINLITYKPMSEQTKPKIPVIGVVLLVVVILIATALIMNVKLAGEREKIQQNIERGLEERQKIEADYREIFGADQSDWQEFASAQYNYHFKHPASWQRISEDQDSFIFASQKDCSYMAGQELSRGCYLAGMAYHQSQSPEAAINDDDSKVAFPQAVAETRTIEVAGYPALWQMSDNYFMLQFKKDGLIYVLSGSFRPSDRAGFTGLLERILASFEFGA